MEAMSLWSPLPKLKQRKLIAEGAERRREPAENPQRNRALVSSALLSDLSDWFFPPMTAASRDTTSLGAPVVAL
jgi:hypothetical protein